MDLKKHWDNVAEEIQNRQSNYNLVGYESVLDSYIRKRFEKVFRKLNIFENSIIEIGSGVGANLVICEEKGSKRIIACDISEKLLKITKARFKEKRKFEFILIDGKNIPLKDEEIDSSFTVTVLQHISNLKILEKLTKEICRITKKNIVIFEDIAPLGKGVKSEDYVVRDKETYIKLIEKNGFKLKSQSLISLKYSLLFLGAINSLFLYKKKEGAKSTKLENLVSKTFLKISSKLDNLKILNKSPRGLSILIFEKL